MDRRSFLTAATIAAASAPLVSAADSKTARAPAEPLIDTNVTLGDWVVRRSWAPTTAKLLERLRRHGVTSAWVATIEGVLHTDLAGANARLAETCAREGAGLLVPFGTVNPTFPDWEDDLRRCHEVHRMPGIRVFPNYHGYTLDDPRFAQLLAAATQRKLLVQIPLNLEDERSHNPVLTAPFVPPGPLADVLEKIPAARVMLLNCGARVLTGNPAVLTRLTKLGAFFDIATLEGIAGIESVFARAPDAKLTFGSHAPYFYFEAALLKLRESLLTPAQLTAVSSANARAALAPA